MCLQQKTATDPLLDDNLVSDFKTEWYTSLCDAHCHPHDDHQRHDNIPQLQTGHIALMGVRLDDWKTVEKVTDSCNKLGQVKAVPCFGIHPWYSYLMLDSDDKTENHYEDIFEGPEEEKQELISYLPPPTPFSEWYRQLEQHLQEHHTALLGEVGLDRAARMLPRGAIEWHGVKPTNVTCRIAHQCAILQKQLQLAIDLERAVSVHCVQSQGHLLSVLQWANELKKYQSKQQRQQQQQPLQRTMHHDGISDNKVHEQFNIARPRSLRVCLHSFGGKRASLDQFFKLSHVTVYVSFSTAINSRLGWRKLSQLIQAVPDDQLLIESDLNTPQGLDDAMVRIAGLAARAKGWSIEKTISKTKQNWFKFTGIVSSSTE